MKEFLHCAFCGIKSAHDEAIDGGWTPYFFWDEATVCDDPVCPACATKHLHDFENEPIVKPCADFSRN